MRNANRSLHGLVPHPPLRATALALGSALLAPACHHVGGDTFGLFGGGTQGPDLIGVARFQDVDANGAANAGDRVVFRFDAAVRVNDPAATPAELFVSGDQWGAGAQLQQGPRADEVHIVLGTGAVLRARGRFTQAGSGPHSPSGARLANVPADAIEDASTGADVSDTNWVDIVPEPVSRSASGLAASARSLGAADLNRDGLVDWVAANGTDGVDVYENLGGGDYLHSNYAVGDTRAVRLVDARGAGRMDVLALTSSGLAWLENTSPVGGAVSFASGDTLGLQLEVRDARALDADGDGDLDVALLADDGVRVMENDGDGNFEGIGDPLEGSPTDGRVLAVGDVDRNSTTDLVIGRDGTEVLLRNEGCGAWSAPETFGGQGSTADLRLADLDRDGDLDAIGVGDGGARVWLGSNGVLVPAGEVSGAARFARLADLDGDAALDALIGDDQGVRVLMNRGDATWLDTRSRLADGSGALDVATGECEGDADVDLLIATEDGLGVWHGSLDGVWGASRLRESAEDVGSGHLFAMASGDMDGDGDPDLVTGRNATLEVHENLGGGHFDPEARVVELGASRAHGIALADVDQDGDLDVLVAVLGTASTVWLNDGAGGLSPYGGGGPFEEATSIAAGDLDGDGDVDYVVGRVRGLNDLLFLNQGIDCGDSGNWLGFGAPLTFPDTPHTAAVELADVDSDGDLDVIFAHGGSVSDRVFENDGAAGFLFTGQDFGARDSRSIAVADLDRDGDLDLVFGKPLEDEVWHNDGAGTFTLVKALEQDATWDVALADLNGDGWPDLIEGRELSQGFRVYFGEPTGTFANGPRSRSVDQNVRRIEVLDVDLDGAPDFVTGMEDDSPNRLFRNL